jgi:hypothetical protein
MEKRAVFNHSNVEEHRYHMCLLYSHQIFTQALRNSAVTVRNHVEETAADETTTMAAD